MQIESDKDFPALQQQLAEWRKRFPMFKHDVMQIEKIIDNHIQNHSKCLVEYRQSHKRSYLEKAQKEIDSINRILSVVEKMELMALLHQR